MEKLIWCMGIMLSINANRLITPRVNGCKNVPKKRRTKESVPRAIAAHIREYVKSE